MTKKIVTDEQLGVITKHIHDLLTRLVNGAVDFPSVKDGLQRLQEGASFSIPEELIAYQVDFYHRVFGFDIEPRLPYIRVPLRKKGVFKRMLIIPRGLDVENVLCKCVELSLKNTFLRASINELGIKADRYTNYGSYAIWVSDENKNDKKQQEWSPDDFKSKKMPGITLLERLLHILQYHDQTGKNLGENISTLCSGSLLAIGNIPCIYWENGKIEFDFHLPDRPLKSNKRIPPCFCPVIF